MTEAIVSVSTLSLAWTLCTAIRSVESTKKDEGEKKKKLYLVSPLLVYSSALRGGCCVSLRFTELTRRAVNGLNVYV